jgi:hypothetical protein
LKEGSRYFPNLTAAPCIRIACEYSILQPSKSVYGTQDSTLSQRFTWGILDTENICLETNKEFHDANKPYEKLPRNLLQNSYVTLDMMTKKICWSNRMHTVLFLFKALSNSFSDTSTAIKDTSMYFKKGQALQCTWIGYSKSQRIWTIHMLNFVYEDDIKMKDDYFATISIHWNHQQASPVGLKQKRFFSFSRKAKITRKWGNFHEISRNFVSRKFWGNFRESFRKNFRLRENFRENFCQKIVKKSGQNMIIPKNKIFA